MLVLLGHIAALGVAATYAALVATEATVNAEAVHKGVSYGIGIYEIAYLAHSGSGAGGCNPNVLVIFGLGLVGLDNLAALYFGNNQLVVDIIPNYVCIFGIVNVNLNAIRATVAVIIVSLQNVTVNITRGVLLLNEVTGICTFAIRTSRIRANSLVISTRQDILGINKITGK